MEAALRSEDSSMTMLQTLADCHGVESLRSYEAAEEKTVREDTLVAILEAMGVASRGDEQRRDSLARLQERARRPLEPLMVIRHEQLDKRIPLALPKGSPSSPLEWRLLEENGTEHEGRIAADDLVKMDRASDEIDHFYFRLPVDLPSGYHSLRVQAGPHEDRSSLVMAPRECFVSEAARQRKLWGVSAQLYSLRSKRDWGIGDFTGATELMSRLAERGGEVLGLSPLHSLPAGNPAHNSPYSPLSRLALNHLYVDPERVPEFAESEEAKRIFFAGAALIEELRASGTVDYPRVSALKLEVLSACYRLFRVRHLDACTPRARDFRRFCESSGPPLDEYALFEAIDEAHARRPEWGWRGWPEELHAADGEACRRFARDNEERVDFFRYLQWQASVQLDAMGGEALARHMGIGLFLDLALGSDPHGAEVWADRALYGAGCSIGSPPDECNPSGQNWGFLPPVPERMKEAGYRPWIRLLRSNMRHAGAIRLDHVMSLWRLFWIPQGMPAAQGTYVYYPADDLLGILALESHRNQCMVVGEDLGTVPDEVRESMLQHKVFSYSVLMFSQKEDGQFSSPGDYRQMSVAAPNTHDLPTLEGFWEGRDLELFRRHRQFPSQAAYERAVSERLRKRKLLLEALHREGVLDGCLPCDPERLPFLSDEIFVAVCAYLARSASRIAIVQIEDVIGQAESINLPGVSGDFHPWSHRLTVGVDQLEAHRRFNGMVEAMSRERGGGASMRRYSGP